MSLQQVWQFTRRWGWIVVLATVLAGAASYVVSSRLPKVYQGVARVLVMPGQGSNAGTQYADVLAAQQLTQTYSQVIRSRPIIEATEKTLGVSLPFATFTNSLDVQPVRDTQLIEITYRSADPVSAAAFANSLAQSFMNYTQQTQSARYKSSLDNLSAQVDQASKDIADRTQQLAALRAQPQSDARDAQISRVSGELTQLQQTYSAAVGSYESVRVSEANRADQISLVDPASPDDNPVAPRVPLNVAVAALLGLVLSGVAVFLIEYLDDRLLSPERLQRFTSLHMLGALTQLPSGSPTTIDRLPQQQLTGAEAAPDQKQRKGPGYGYGYGSSQVSESFRLLLANLQFAAIERPLHTLLVTSADAGDGKTTTAANLAIVQAQSGKRVLLVDADLRRPSQHRTFEIPNRTGMTSLLVDETLDWHSTVVATRVSNLWLLPSGPMPPNPSELLSSHRMRERLAELSAGYDLVIVDSPPVRAVSDPAVLAGLVDGTLLVVSAARTRGQHAANALETLRKAGGNVLGAVMNRLPRDGASYYGYYYYGYGYAPTTGTKPAPSTTTV